jgi:phospholipid/cholesterol/gamma-HCH transport system substrate-binding protein
MAEITIRISDRVLRIAGIFLGGISIACVFLFLSSSGLFVPKYQLQVYAAEVQGLSVGSPVLLDGVQVGAVNAITLAQVSASPERRIQLVLRIEKRYQEAIRTDSTATVMTEGLLGNRYVSIQRGFRGKAISPNPKNS